MDVAAAFLLSLVAAGSLLILAANFLRWSREPARLTPNCLLTRSPIVFVTGARSPFYFRNYWNSLPLYLSAHGYDVQVLRLPWRDSEERVRWAGKLLESRPCHLVVDRESAREIAELLKRLPVRSLYIPRASTELPPFWALIDRLHSAWLRSKGLSHPVSLRELGVSDPRSAAELLRFIRNEAEREWVEALASTSENPVEESSKA